MLRLDHNSTPLFDALKRYMADKTISFHVPGHKQGVGCPDFTDFVGKNVMTIDVTVHEEVDGITNPRGVIKAAEELAADAFGVQAAHFLVNGTTSGIQAMIMSVCRPGDKIILPRNAHRSVQGALTLSGAIPIYIQPEVHDFLGFAMGITPESVEEALRAHRDAKAVFVINPTYYGVAGDLKAIIEIAHSYGVAVLADEAHGAHFRFHPDLPLSAASAGADMAAISTHKLLGSLTQSSMLLVNSNLVTSSHVKQVLNLTQTTSPSYLLLASLDVARQQAVLRGRELLERTIQLCNWARAELNQIPGVYVPGEDLHGLAGCFQYDPTKLVINLRGVGISGFAAERFLRDEHRIQVELSDLYNVLAVGSIGDTQENMERLVDAVKQMVKAHGRPEAMPHYTCMPSKVPETVILPRDAFHIDSYPVPLEDAVGLISAENVMAYPPGMPLVCIGERITQEVVDCIKLLQRERGHLQGTEDCRVNTIRVLRACEAVRRVANN
ncbi:MAG: aminotransferase class I/II-fold pyridoxal phosphate-dependent enzyme [Bacillota bacterium]|jgi:arginine decarboxylase